MERDILRCRAKRSQTHRQACARPAAQAREKGVQGESEKVSKREECARRAREKESAQKGSATRAQEGIARSKSEKSRRKCAREGPRGKER
eukprot:6184308-Pleurochrysis_carterae.AAC.1